MPLLGNSKAQAARSSAAVHWSPDAAGELDCTEGAACDRSALRFANRYVAWTRQVLIDVTAASYI